MTLRSIAFAAAATSALSLLKVPAVLADYDSGQESSRKRYYLKSGMVLRMVFLPIDREELHREIRLWRRAASYQLVSAVDLLVEYMNIHHYADPLNHPTGEKVPRNVMMRRAQVALGEVLQVRLQPVLNSKSSDEECGQAYASARKLVNVYKLAASRVARDKEFHITTDKLKKMYTGRFVHFDKTGKLNSSYAMHQLFVQWYPLGKKLEELESIVGYKAVKRESSYYYEFTAPFSGGTYQLIVRDGVITRVE